MDEQIGTQTSFSASLGVNRCLCRFCPPPMSGTSTWSSGHLSKIELSDRSVGRTASNLEIDKRSRMGLHISQSRR